MGHNVPFPTFKPGTLLMVATSGFDEAQSTNVVRSCIELSEYIPMAVNCRFSPIITLEVVVGIVIDTSTAGVIVRSVEPEMLPDVAVIVAVPTDSDVASPLEPGVLLMSAIPVFDEFQVTDAVISCVELSE